MRAGGLLQCTLCVGIVLMSYVLVVTSARAEDCQRGSLDKRYCDRDGDLVADLPLDDKAWVNPDTLIFSYTPVEDPAVSARVWDGFVKHLGKATGKKVVFFPVQSNAAQLEAMRSGRLHIAGVNTGGNPVAVNYTGFVPFAMMVDKDGAFGYRMEVIVAADSPIRTLADLKGKTVAFTSPTLNSGFKAPSVLLKSEFGLEGDKDYKAVFSGKHDTSVLGVANKDYDAATVANEVKKRMIARGVVDGAKLRVIYESGVFPTTGYGHVYNLHPVVAARIKQAFFTFPWEGSELQNECKSSGQFAAITYKTDWETIRKIDAASGVTYACK